jgi:diguanylate cyclase (GGDEF)-like protein
MTPLDVRTVFVMLLVSTVLMAATVALGQWRTRTPGLAKWSIGLALYAGGWVLAALYGAIPEALRVSAASGVLIAGVCFQAVALLEYDRQRVAPWVLWAPGAALALVALALASRFDVRTLVSGVAFSAALSVLSIIANRGSVAPSAVRRLLSLTMAVAAVAVMVRAVGVYARPEAYPDMFATSALHTLTYVVLFAAIITSSFAFLVMQREDAEAELRRLAMFDPLTGTLNRRAFMELAEREIGRMRRTGQPLAVVMLDLDHFKAVNDAYGHQAGDRVLADFAGRAAGCLRATDVLGRYGGEEFCAMLSGTSHADAMAIAERVRASVLAAPLGGLAQAVTVSIGVASFDGASAPALEYLIGRADSALYAAKGLGRNRVVGIEPARSRVTPDAAALRAA